MPPARLGGRPGSKEESELARTCSIILSPSLTPQVVFSSKLAADTPMGAVSGRGQGSKPEPLTLENKPKQPRRLMTQYTSGNRGPFPLGSKRLQ